MMDLLIAHPGFTVPVTTMKSETLMAIAKRKMTVLSSAMEVMVKSREASVSANAMLLSSWNNFALRNVKKAF